MCPPSPHPSHSHHDEVLHQNHPSTCSCYPPAPSLHGHPVKKLATPEANAKPHHWCQSISHTSIGTRVATFKKMKYETTRAYALCVGAPKFIIVNIKWNGKNNISTTTMQKRH